MLDYATVCCGFLEHMKHLLLLLAVFLQAGGQPVILSISNASFEQPLTVSHPSTEQCGTFAWGDVPGWNFGANAGIFQPFQGNTCLIPPPPDGQTYAYAGYGGTFYKDTGIKASDLQAVSRDGVYTLTFWIVNYLGSYPGNYEAEIDLATVDPQTGQLSNEQELCPNYGWATQNLSQVTLTCLSPGFLVFDNIFVNGAAIPADSNAHLIIRFTGLGWTLLVDNAYLTFTPQ
jgi:hypothetical protein